MQASTLTWPVEISAGALPPVSISVPWSEGEAKQKFTGTMVGSCWEALALAIFLGVGGEVCNLYVKH